MPPYAHTDITGSVSFREAARVIQAIDALFAKRHGAAWDSALLAAAVSDLCRAFRGEYPGLAAADTPYHDLRHSLDTGLTMARLIDGYEREAPARGEAPLGAQHSLLGIVLALFHDVGFLRRDSEAAMPGAMLGADHEARSVAFVQEYLAGTRLASLAPRADLIMATSLKWGGPDALAGPWRALAQLLGTADLVCQIADPNYLQRCRDHLYDEFAIAGLAGGAETMYPDRETLLRKTSGFLTGLVRPRLERELGDAQRFLAVHFGGADLYAQGLQRNLARLERMAAAGDFDELGPAPEPLYQARS